MEMVVHQDNLDHIMTYPPSPHKALYHKMVTTNTAKERKIRSRESKKTRNLQKQRRTTSKNIMAKQCSRTRGNCKNSKSLEQRTLKEIKSPQTNEQHHGGGRTPMENERRNAEITTTKTKRKSNYSNGGRSNMTREDKERCRKHSIKAQKLKNSLWFASCGKAEHRD